MESRTAVPFAKLPSAATEHTGPAPNARHRTLRPLSNGIGRQETSMRGMTSLRHVKGGFEGGECFDGGIKETYSCTHDSEIQPAGSHGL